MALVKAILLTVIGILYLGGGSVMYMLHLMIESSTRKISRWYVYPAVALWPIASVVYAIAYVVAFIYSVK